jgi:Ran GTPase-activating protein (RanGAP) involved in mRNA processing and transport
MDSESFQELEVIDLSHNLLENNGILSVYKMLKGRYTSLKSIDLSGNSINEEGFNLFLKGKILGDAPLA